MYGEGAAKGDAAWIEGEAAVSIDGEPGTYGDDADANDAGTANSLCEPLEYGRAPCVEVIDMASKLPELASSSARILLTSRSSSMSVFVSTIPRLLSGFERFENAGDAANGTSLVARGVSTAFDPACSWAAGYGTSDGMTTDRIDRTTCC